MLKEYKFNKWEYSIEKESNKYGFYLLIFKNGILDYKWSGFGAESIALSYLKKYIIENEHDIELNN